MISSAFRPDVPPFPAVFDDVRRAAASPTCRGRSPLGSAIVAYFAALPLLWATGLALPVALLLMAAAAITTAGDRRAIRYAWPWYAVGVAQLISVVVNWAMTDGSPGGIAKHLIAAYVSGWFLIGAAIGAGASGLVSLDDAVSSVRRIAKFWAVLAIPTVVAAYTLGVETLSFVTPVGMLLPDSLPSKSFSFTGYLFSWDDLFGVEAPRILPLFPWANILGVAGIAVTLVALADPARPRRTLMAIGTLMVAASLGRMPIVALVVVLLLRWWLDVGPAAKIVTVIAPLWVAVTVAIAVGAQFGVVGNASEMFDAARPGSSQVRDEVYDANWQGFYDAPWIGHGWTGEAVYERDDKGTGMVVGSHSSISGTLYKGGVLAFAMLMVAFLATAWPLIVRRAASGQVKSALCFLMALGIACGAESIESFAAPLLFVFVWLGAVLGTSDPATKALT